MITALKVRENFYPIVSRTIKSAGVYSSEEYLSISAGYNILLKILTNIRDGT